MNQIISRNGQTQPFSTHILPFAVIMTEGQGEVHAMAFVIVFQRMYSTLETRYNAVLGVHRSDPRYIRVDGYNAVYVSPPAHEWPVSAVDRLIL